MSGVFSEALLLCDESSDDYAAFQDRFRPPTVRAMLEALQAASGLVVTDCLNQTLVHANQMRVARALDEVERLLGGQDA